MGHKIDAPIRGYKILEHDLKCHPTPQSRCVNSRQYELMAKQYTIPGTFEEKFAIAGFKGMHFAPTITNLSFGKRLEQNGVVVEVEARGLVDVMSAKRCPWFASYKTLNFTNAIIATTNLTIIRKLEPQEVWDLFLTEIREWSTQDRDAAVFLANEFWLRYSGAYFNGVSNFTKKEFEERTGLIDTYWSQYSMGC